MKLSPEMAHFQRNNAFQGAELITGTHRLNTMNLLLHGIDQPIDCIDALTADAEKFDPADLILTNPPFNKFPESTTRNDFVITAGSRKGPLPFMEHVVRGLNEPDVVRQTRELRQEWVDWFSDAGAELEEVIAPAF